MALWITLKKRGETYWNRPDKFVKECRTDLFDIKGSPEQIKEQAKLWGLKMNSDVEIFYQNQPLHPQIGYCTNFTTRRDILAQKRKEEEHENHIKLTEKSKNDIKLLERNHCSDMISDEETLTNEDEDNTHDEDYVMNASKSSFNESFFESRHDDMPIRYHHIKCEERQVKPEYLLMHVLKPNYHMSENMAQGAITEVANYLFGRKEHGRWKSYKSGEPYKSAITI